MHNWHPILSRLDVKKTLHPGQGRVFVVPHLHMRQQTQASRSEIANDICGPPPTMTSVMTTTKSTDLTVTCFGGSHSVMRAERTLELPLISESILENDL